MLFTSQQFALFFAVFLPLYLFARGAVRTWLIIVASAVFYGAWDPGYAFMPFLLIAVGYAGSLWTMRAEGEAAKHRLWVTLAVLCLPLILVKYLPFLNNSFCSLAGCDLLPKNVLPLGISFITFTLIAYIVDVRDGRYRASDGFPGVLGLVLFFPHLIAGPILRPAELIPQIVRGSSLLRRMRLLFPLGMILFAVGFAKKTVFADAVSVSVDKVYAMAPEALSGADALAAIYGFATQIYCDFSGYTDMALGIALMLGVRLPENFRSPYSACSPGEFWRRWHMTLSRWLRDYVYIRLGGNRCRPARRTLNVFATMALGGMWHGASWTFLIWGLYHAVGITAGGGLERFAARNRLAKAIAIVLTFHFVIFGWVLFRAASLEQALGVVRALGRWPSGLDGLTAYAGTFGLSLLILAVHRIDSLASLRRWTRRVPHAAPAGLAIVIILLAVLLSTATSAKFIYFDF